MGSDYIRKFFSSDENWKHVRNICRYHFPKGYDAEDVAQDIAKKLLESNGETHFPQDHEEQIKFITRMAMNYFLDDVKKKKNGLKLVDEKEAWNIGEVEMPEQTDKISRLNEAIIKKSHLFTKDQLKLWNCVYNRMTAPQIAQALVKSIQNIYSQLSLLREKIRKKINKSEYL